MLARVFITFEGLDGSGKTTQVELLKQALEADGREVVATREPGGTELGEAVREVVLHRHEEIVPWAEAALFAAARAQLVERLIAPALARGATVLCDRYIDSSLAYQGIARGLGLDLVLQVNLTVLEGLLPDRTFVVAVDAATAAARREGKPDRIEQEGDGFQAEVGRAYEQLAERFPERVELVDGRQPPAEIAAEVRRRLGV